MGLVLSTDLYKSVLQSIEAEFEVRRRDLESERRKAIEALNEAWPKMGGSERDLLSTIANTAEEVAVSSSVEDQIEEEDIPADPPQEADEATPASNGDLSKRTVHTMTIMQEVDKAISDGSTDEITQSDLKERILEKYPNAKVASLAASISRHLSQLTESGRLELVEKGTASRPHKYRVKRDSPERNLLGP